LDPTYHILLTGATGFIGQHLAAGLLREGVALTCVAREPAKLSDLGSWQPPPEVIQGDLTHRAILAKLPDDIDVCIHMAASLGSWGARETTILRNNVVATQHLLDWFSKSSGRQFLFVSTPGVQGFGRKAAVETDPCAPRGIYEISKVLAEKRVRRKRLGAGQHWTIVRPDFVYGPGDIRRIKLYRQIGRRQWIRIGSGHALMRPTHVRDVCAAILACVGNPRAYSQTFNIAGPAPVSANQFVDTIARLSGVRLPPVWLPATCFELAATALEWLARSTKRPPLFSKSQVQFFTQDHATDISRIQECIGFRPQISFDDGMRETLQWARDHKLLLPRKAKTFTRKAKKVFSTAGDSRKGR